MDLPWIIWEIAINAIEKALFVFLLIRQLDSSKVKKRYLVLGYFILVINETILNFSGMSLLPTVIILMAVDLAFTLLVFKGSLPKRLLWGCSGMIIAQLCNMITVNLFSLFGNISLLDSTAPTQTRFEMMICYILLYALFYFILAHIHSRKKIFLKWYLRFILIAIFAVGLVAIQKIIDIYLVLSGVHAGADLALIDNNLSIISAIIIGTYLGMLFLFEYIGSLAQKNIDAQEELQQTKWENAQLKHVSDTYQALRAWKHDFQNHLDIIHTYLEQNKLEELDGYISEIKTETGPFMHLYYTGNNVIDAVLSNKLFIAYSKGIQIKSSVFLPETLNIPDSQLCSVLSNLLDNAIEAQNGVALPYLQIMIHQERGMLYIKIENSSNGSYLYKDKQLSTLKKIDGHGIGLQQVKKIVENLKGIINIEPKPDCFMVQILIPINMEGAQIA